MSLLRGADDLAAFIAGNYSGSVVEVGVGYFADVALGLLALDLGADVLVRPLMDEVAQLPGFARRLVNSGEARYYLLSVTS